MPRVAPFIILLGLALLAGCIEQREAEVLPESPSPLCEGVPPRSLDEVYAQHFSGDRPTGCTLGCHEQGVGALTFTNARELWQATVHRAASQPARLLVEPRWPERSHLYLKLLPDAPGRMPQGGPYLDEAALREVAGWICAGAPEPSTVEQPPDNPRPGLETLQPSSVATHGAPFTLTLTGTGFLAGSTVTLDGADVPTTYVGPTTLTARIPTLTAEGSYPVAVRNPAPGGGTSNDLPLTAAHSSAPTLTGLEPARVDADTAFTLALTGSGYACSPPASILFNGSTYTPSSCTATRLEVSLPATPRGDYPVQVRNADGESSNPLTLGVGAPIPLPEVSSLSPCGTVAGSGAFALTLRGAHFLQDSSVTFNGSPVTVSYVSASELRADIPASLVASAPASRAAPVLVTNPAPGGGASAPAYFGVASRAVTLADDVQPIFTASCASGGGCHSSPATSVNLSTGRSYDELVNRPSSGCNPRLLVQLCGPLRTQSVLIDKILATNNSPACSGAPMPKGTPLPEAQKQAIIDWVAQGAPR